MTLQSQWPSDADPFGVSTWVAGSTKWGFYLNRVAESITLDIWCCMELPGDLKNGTFFADDVWLYGFVLWKFWPCRPVAIKRSVAMQPGSMFDSTCTWTSLMSILSNCRLDSTRHWQRAWPRLPHLPAILLGVLYPFSSAIGLEWSSYCLHVESKSVLYRFPIPSQGMQIKPLSALSSNRDEPCYRLVYFMAQVWNRSIGFDWGSRTR